MIIQRRELLQRLPVLAVAVVLALGFVPARPAQAQEQTFYACYVPEVGAIYLIRLEGLPEECLSVEHVEISWTEGGSATIPDNSITTAKLVDFAVTTAKLAGNAVTNAKLADNAVDGAIVADNSLTAADLAANSVGASEIINGSVTTTELAAPVSIASNNMGSRGDLPTSPTNLGLVQISAPTSGKVLLILTGYAPRHTCDEDGHD